MEIAIAESERVAVDLQRPFADEVSRKRALVLTGVGSGAEEDIGERGEGRLGGRDLKRTARPFLFQRSPNPRCLLEEPGASGGANRAREALLAAGAAVRRDLEDKITHRPTPPTQQAGESGQGLMGH